MIKSINQKPKNKKIEIDLTGPDGNLFNLISVAMNISKSINKQIGCELYDTKSIVNEMMSGDYENAINVFEKNFGDYVILYR